MENLEIANSANDELQGLKSNRVAKPNYQRNFIVNCLFNLVNIRGFTLLMFLTALLLVSLVIFYNNFISINIKQCKQLKILRKQSFQLNQCTQDCRRCEIYNNLQKCLKCNEEKQLFKANCINDCPIKSQPFEDICISSLYNTSKLQLITFNSLLLENYQLSYLAHRVSNSSSSLIFVLTNQFNEDQLNWQKIADKTASNIIELSVTKGLSNIYDSTCGRTLFSQFFLDEFLPTVIQQLNLKSIQTIVLVGLEDTSDEAFQIQTHIYQVVQTNKKKLFKSTQIEYNTKEWKEMLEKNFITAAIGINSSFQNEDFLKDQIRIPYRRTDNLVINLKGNIDLESQLIKTEMVNEEYVIEFVNSIYRQQIEELDCK